MESEYKQRWLAMLEAFPGLVDGETYTSGADLIEWISNHIDE